MKEKKTIVIKDSLLRRIRNNFRRILILETSKRRGRIRDRRIAIEHDLSGDLRDLSTEEKRKVIDLCTLSNHLSQGLTESICVCSKCQAIDKDMTYNSTFKKWYCVDCFNGLRDIYFREKPLMVQEGDWDAFNEKFFRSFTKF